MPAVKTELEDIAKNIIGKQVNNNSNGVRTNTTVNTGTVVPAEEQKYILSIKVNTPQSATEVQNSSVQNNMAGQTETAGVKAQNQNINIDLTTLNINKRESAIQLFTDKTQAPVKELFNPPITLKLSIKQQIKSVDNKSAESSKFVPENSAGKIKVEAAKTNPAPGQNSLKNNSVVNKGSSENIQSFTDYLQSPTELNSNNAGQEVKKSTDSANGELAGSVSKNAGSTQKINDNNSGSAVKQVNQTGGEIDKPVASSDNSGGELGNKSEEEKQKGADFKTAGNQSVNDFEKLLTAKDKIPDKSGQMSQPAKTINASDIAKEFTSIINQKDSKSVVLQLKPENLGKIKLSIDVTNNIVHARVEVENEAAKQMVQSNLDALKHSLNLSGLQLSTVDVSLSGGQQKSFKSYGPKKKFNYTGKNTKISEEPDTSASRNMGYNTYEYLI